MNGGTGIFRSFLLLVLCIGGFGFLVRDSVERYTQIEQLKIQNEQLQTQILSLQDQFSAAGNTIKTLEAEIATLLAKLEEYVVAYNDLSGRIAAYEAEAQRLEQQRDEAVLQAAIWKDGIEKAQAEIQALSEQINQLTLSLQAEQAARLRVQEELNLARQENEQTRQKMEQMEVEQNFIPVTGAPALPGWPIDLEGFGPYLLLAALGIVTTGCLATIMILVARRSLNLAERRIGSKLTNRPRRTNQASQVVQVTMTRDQLEEYIKMQRSKDHWHNNGHQVIDDQMIGLSDNQPSS